MKYNESIQADGSNFSGAEAKLFTWPGSQGRNLSMRKVVVHNLYTSGVNLYVWVNGAASATKALVVLEPGDTFESPYLKIIVSSIGLYSTGAATYKTDFFVTGWVHDFKDA